MERKEKDLFQFHNGSIKTIDWNTARVQEKVFQFHNGSIKTFFGM